MGQSFADDQREEEEEKLKKWQQKDSYKKRDLNNFGKSVF